MKSRTIFLAIILTLIISGCNGKKPEFEQVVSDPSPTITPTPKDTPTPTITPSPTPTPVGAWAVLAEKDDYSDVGKSDMLVDYIDIKRMEESLLALGWPSAQIHTLIEYDQKAIEDELIWILQNADEDDIIFFYITGHGSYLRQYIDWHNFFPMLWEQIPSPNRVLIVDMCTAAEFTNAVNGDPHPHLSIASVDFDEYAWKCLKDEELPIIGAIFTYYFADALLNPKANINGDKIVSVQEAALFAEERQREFMQKEIFSNPEFLQGYHDLGSYPEKDPTFPDVIIDDALGFPLDLTISE
jgi:hypothetical protein